MLTLITNGTILTLNDQKQVFDKGFILIEDDHISKIGEGEPDAETRNQSDRSINASNMAVLPGLVNAHTHLFQTFLRGLGDDLPLATWLTKYIWPVSTNMTVPDATLAARLGIIENIRSGVTSIIDNQYLHNVPEMDDAFCQSALDLGVRFYMARGWADRNYHPAFIETPDQVIERLTSLIEKWNRHPSARIRVEISPLSQARCTDETTRKVGRLAADMGVGIHIHTAETKAQTESCIQETGLRPVEWLYNLNCLTPSTQVVHAVWLSDHDLELLVETSAKVMHCPVSNMYLSSGVARVPEMRKMGITVALATDGPGSNNNQDMVETLKTTALLHKVTTMDARVFLPEDILWMACRGGAEAFGQPKSIGSLEVGKKADVVLVDMNTPFAVPVHRPASALVYNLNGNNVDTVIVDGKVLMREKKILGFDEQGLLEECRASAASLIKRTNFNN